MSKTPERLAYEAWYRKQFDSTMYCESTWRGWEAGRAALTQAADAGAAEPVAYYCADWALTPWAYNHARKSHPDVQAFADMKPAYAAPPAQQLQQAVARAEAAVLALMRTGNPTTDLFVAGFNVAIGCAVDAIRQQGTP